MQPSDEVECVCVRVLMGPRYMGPDFFFLLQLIRVGNSSLLRFHLSGEPLEAECGLQGFRGGPRRCQAQHTQQWKVVLKLYQTARL